MPFTVKNIVNYPISIFNRTILPNKTLDLLTITTEANIKTSLLYGVLFNYMLGRTLAIVNPREARQIGLTTTEFAKLSASGIFQGHLGSDVLLSPFTFDSAGGLITSGGGGGPVTGTVTVQGIDADGAPVTTDPVLTGGEDPGGNIQNIAVDAVGNQIVVGPSADGSPYYGSPVEVGGVDFSGNIQTMATDMDGYVFIANFPPAAPAATFGPVADGGVAYGFPVEIGGVDSLGNVYSIAVDASGNQMMIGPVADGGVANGFPVEMGGVDALGNVQSIMVNTDGEIELAGYDSATDALKVVNIANLNSVYTTSTLISTTNLAIATYYYPSSAGMDMNNYKDLSLEIDVPAVITVTVEASNDNTFANPKDITVSGNELTTNTAGTASFSNASVIVDFDDMNIRYVRVVVVVANATNTIDIVARRKAL